MESPELPPDPPFTREELAHFDRLRERLRAVAPYDLPSPARDRMWYLQTMASAEPPPEVYLREMRSKADYEAWRAKLGRHIVSVRQGLTAAHYHRDKVAEIEQAILQAVRTEPGLRSRPQLPTYHQFPALPMTYEYHAFLFADRRTLEYLAVFAAWFFGRNCHRIKRLERAIAGSEPAEARDRLTKRLASELPSLAISLGEPKNARDRVAHREALDAGTVALIGDPNTGPRVALIRGHDELPGVASLGLNPSRELSGLGLLETLDQQLTQTENFVFDALRDLGVLPSDELVARFMSQFLPND